MRCVKCVFKLEKMVHAGLHHKTITNFIKKSIELNRAYSKILPINSQQYHKLQYELAQAELLLAHLKNNQSLK